MTMITPSYLGETIEYSSLHACRSTLEDPTEAMSLTDRFWPAPRSWCCFRGDGSGCRVDWCLATRGASVFWESVHLLLFSRSCLR